MHKLTPNIVIAQIGFRKVAHPGYMVGVCFTPGGPYLWEFTILSRAFSAYTLVIGAPSLL